MNSHPTREAYIASVDSVLAAGRRLQRALDADRDTLEGAKEALQREFNRHDGIETGYQSFRFQQLDTPQSTAKTTRKQTADEVLAAAVLGA